MPFNWQLHRNDWTLIMDRIEILAGEDVAGFDTRLKFLEALYDFSQSPEGLAIQGDNLANPIDLVWIFGEACGITSKSTHEEQAQIHSLVDDLIAGFKGDPPAMYKALHPYHVYLEDFLSRRVVTRL